MVDILDFTKEKNRKCCLILGFIVVLYFILPVTIVSVFFNAFRNIGNYAIVNGIGTSNKSLGAIILFIALFIGFGKYVKQEDLICEPLYSMVSGKKWASNGSIRMRRRALK